MHGFERISPSERPLPRLVLPEKYDHLGKRYESPLQEAALRHTWQTRQITPDNLLLIINNEIQDIRDQRKEFWHDHTASKPWKERRRLISQAKTFFDTHETAQKYLVEDAIPDRPFTIRRAEMDILTQALDPFATRITQLENIYDTLFDVFGLSDADFDPKTHEHELGNAHHYLADQKERFSQQEESNEFATLFEEFGHLLEKHLEVFSETDSLTKGVDKFDTAKFTSEYNHFERGIKNNHYLSPLLDGEIARKGDELLTTDRDASVFDVCDLIAAEITDIEDQEANFLQNPSEVKILKSSDFADNMELLFFKNQRVRLESMLSAFEMLIAPPQEGIPADQQTNYQLLRSEYMIRLERRWGLWANKKTSADEEYKIFDRASVFQKIKSAVYSSSQSTTN